MAALTSRKSANPGSSRVASGRAALPRLRVSDLPLTDPDSGVESKAATRGRHSGASVASVDPRFMAHERRFADGFVPKDGKSGRKADFPSFMPLPFTAGLVKSLRTPDREKRSEFSELRVTPSRMNELLKIADRERFEDILRAHIAAALPLQQGAREQAHLAGSKMQSVLARIVMLTAREVGQRSGSRAAKPEGLAAQWVSRQQIFGVDLVGHGTRYPDFQFQESGKPWPVLGEVLPELVRTFSAIYLLLWFDEPHPELQGKAPREVMEDGAGVHRAVRATLAPIAQY